MELKTWFRTWERNLPRQSSRQRLREVFLEQQKRRQGSGKGVQGTETAAAFLAQEVSLIRRSLGSLLLACEALTPPAALVVISSGFDLEPERFYFVDWHGPWSNFRGQVRDLATEVGDSLAARGCLVFAAVVPQATGSGEPARWTRQHYDPQVVPPESDGVVTGEDLSGWQVVTVPTGGKAKALAEFQWQTDGRGLCGIGLQSKEDERLDGVLELQGFAEGKELWHPKRIDVKTHPLVGEELALRAFQGRGKGFLPVSAELEDPVVYPDGSGVGLLRVTLHATKEGLPAYGNVGRLTACVVCPGVLPAFSAVSLEAPKSSWVLDQEIHWPSKGCELAAVVELWPLGSWGASVLKLPTGETIEGEK
ncbi:MAG: hypothetical protein ACK42L_01445 [Thermoanaerobaculum sp.]